MIYLRSNVTIYSKVLNKIMNDIICQITWTKQDVIDAFISKYKREPTSTELSECMKNFSNRQMEDRCIEFGWDFIFNSVK